jgi:hypothetical protein
LPGGFDFAPLSPAPSGAPSEYLPRDIPSPVFESASQCPTNDLADVEIEFGEKKTLPPGARNGLLAKKMTPLRWWKGLLAEKTPPLGQRKGLFRHLTSPLDPRRGLFVH